MRDRFYRTVKPFSEMSLEEVTEEMDLPYKNEIDKGFHVGNEYHLGFQEGREYEKRQASTALFSKSAINSAIHKHINI